MGKTSTITIARDAASRALARLVPYAGQAIDGSGPAGWVRIDPGEDDAHVILTASDRDSNTLSFAVDGQAPYSAHVSGALLQRVVSLSTRESVSVAVDGTTVTLDALLEHDGPVDDLVAAPSYGVGELVARVSAGELVSVLRAAVYIGSGHATSVGAHTYLYGLAGADRLDVAASDGYLFLVDQVPLAEGETGLYKDLLVPVGKAVAKKAFALGRSFFGGDASIFVDGVNLIVKSGTVRIALRICEGSDTPIPSLARYVPTASDAFATISASGDDWRGWVNLLRAASEWTRFSVGSAGDAAIKTERGAGKAKVDTARLDVALDGRFLRRGAGSSVMLTQDVAAGFDLVTNGRFVDDPDDDGVIDPDGDLTAGRVAVAVATFAGQNAADNPITGLLFTCGDNPNRRVYGAGVNAAAVGIDTASGDATNDGQP